MSTLRNYYVIFRLVEQSGYKFKNQFKTVKTPFSVTVKPG
jgi:hypothetical protein